MVGSPLYSSVATASPMSTTSTISNASTSSSLSHTSFSSAAFSSSSFLLSPTNSASLPASTATSPTLPTTSLTPPQPSTPHPHPQPALRHYFAHAGSLIKLVGGRKRAKLLFRSTKIQVFKDINLIRLRDGCSGVSMDLWFPSERRVVGRSQRHVAAVQGYLARWRWMGVLAAVVKTFMQQQLLNSGYSGLGSYGVLLMIVRFMQVDGQRRQEAEADAQTSEAAEEAEDVEDQDEGEDEDDEVEDEDEEEVREQVESDAAASCKATSAAGGEDESNVGRVLCGFFRFWAEFDYVNQAVDVRGDGSFIDKPPFSYSSNSSSSGQRKATHSGASGVGAESDDEEQQACAHAHTEQSAGDSTVNEADNDGPLSSKRGRRAVASSDRLSLVIVDPCDATNHIVCHHKALRNMIAAFTQAVAVLDPTAPPVVPAPEVMSVAAWDDMLPAVPLTSSAPSAVSSLACSVAVSAVGSTASTAPASPLTSKPASGVATPASATRTTSPDLHSATAPPLTCSPPLLKLHNQQQQQQQDVPALSSLGQQHQPQKSRFHRLIDFNQARLGPSMKLCPSPACHFADGSITQCPVQNKVCYTCGHTFVKQQQQQLHISSAAHSTHTTAPAVQPKQKDSAHGHEGKGHTGRRGRGKGHKAHSAHLAPTAAARLPASMPASSSSSSSASGYSPPLNVVTANGTILNTNGMKFVHTTPQQPSLPPPSASPAARPLVPSITPAAAAGGFVYVNSPPLTLAAGVPLAFAPPPFSLSTLSMPVSPYYPHPPPAGPAAGAAAAATAAGYYGHYDPSAFSYAPYTRPSGVHQQHGPAAAGAGKRFHGQRGGRGGGGGAALPGGGRSYGAPTPHQQQQRQHTYYDPSVAAPPSPYLPPAAFYPPAVAQPPHSTAAYFVPASPAAAIPHTAVPVGRF